MPRRKEKTKKITTQDEEEITPNKTVIVGTTKIKATKNPKGEIITINHNKGRTIISALTSVVLYVVSTNIILTTSPKLSITNG
jgi:hypothetical protein